MFPTAHSRAWSSKTRNDTISRCDRRRERSAQLLPTGALAAVFAFRPASTDATTREKMEREKLVLSSLPDLSVQILDQAREHGRVSIGEIIKLTGASRNTLKEHFRQLVEKGHLTMHGGGRSTWYTLS